MLKHVTSSSAWNRRNVGQDGFTLVELVVVIVILGILAAVVVVVVNGIQERGEADACKTEKKTIEAAAAEFYSDSTATPKEWPASSAVLEDEGYIRDPEYAWDIDEDGVITGRDLPDGCVPTP